MEKEFRQAYEGTVLLTDPNGVIFMSSRNDWLYCLLWKLPPEEISRLAKSKQFGEGPWNWTGLERKDSTYAIDRSGSEYLIRQVRMDNYPGWSIIFLRSLRSISKKISDPLLRTTVPIILTLCVLIGLSVLYLYKKASHDIFQRKVAEEALRESGKTARALLNAPTESALLLDTSGTILALNRPAADSLDKSMEELVGLNAFDQFSPDIAESRKARHEEVLGSGKPVR